MNNRKIKIIHIINTLGIGGIERIVIELCNRLDPQKYDVTLVILSNNKLDLKDNVAKHINLILVPLKHKSSSFFDSLSLILHILKITKIFKEVKPDIIHTHTFQYNVMPILLALRIAAKNASHFHTIHTFGIHYENQNINQRIKLKIEDWWYNRCRTQIVCISPIIKKQIDVLFTKKTKPTIIICNGIDLDKFSKISNLNYVDQIIRIAYTARCEYGKSHDTLLKAFSTLNKKYHNIELILIGDGLLRSKLELMAKDLNINDQVKFLGNCENVPMILANCNIGVFPSEFEGFGIALIEMMAMGLPIVCTDLPIFRVLQLNESNVLFFPSRNDNLLAQQIEKFIISEELRCEYTQKSVEYSKQFSIENMVTKYDSIYNKIVE